MVAVPTRGVERWLTQCLSARLGATPGREDGVCANVEFPFPGRLVGGAVASATGIDRDDDPWLVERSVWPLLEVVDDCLGEPWLASLAAHLGGGGPGPDTDKRTRRFTSVRHIADLYDRYGVHRPAMVRRWATGDDTDGEGRPLADDAAWQAQLWRHLRERIGRPSPAERLDDACTRLRQDGSLSDLPRRLSLFGLTRLPASYLQVLHALAVGRHVHLFLLHPSPVLWEHIAEATPTPRTVTRRTEDTTTDLPRNPLLGSWGRDAREMQLVLTAGDDPHADHHLPVEAPAATLLQLLQSDVRADRKPPGPPLPDHEDTRPVLDTHDRSLQVHACHGRARQVEVLRDAILHLLAGDDSLEARDVIVMCPDIETFAPLIHATFGAGAEDVNDAEDDAALPPTEGRPDLRVRLADRSLRQTNPLLGVASELLALADARLTASQVLDLAGRDPVRRRFRLDDDDLARMEEWVADTGVRWGLDADHRAPFQLHRLEANTWRAGLDRVLLGVAMAEEDQRLVGGVLPLDDVDSGAIDLAGRFAELLDRLQSALDALRAPQSANDWAAAIAAAGDALGATTPGDSWQRAQIGRLLDEVVDEATTDGTTSPAELTLPEIRAVLADRLRGRPTRANFRTGHLTICTLVPMRSVPHRVVCLLGLDDGVFPRKTARDGDDLILDDPHVGDRDARAEDRQLLLDALLAATETLVITYAGRDERTNAERPPAVPVGELLDVVDRTVRAATAARDVVVGGGDGDAWAASADTARGAGAEDPDAPAHRQVLVHHPLQPFDGRNFTAGALIPERPWSFDAVALEGARAVGAPRRPPPPFLPDRLPPLATTGIVELDQLERFVQHPVRAFLRQRLGISVADYSTDVDDALPVELDALEKWGVGDRLLAARVAGADLDACVAAEVARGILPPGALAVPILDDVRPTVEGLVAAAGSLVGDTSDRQSIEVNLELPDGRLLVGTVPGVSPNLVATIIYSRVGPKHRLAAWVRFLALTAARPDAAFEAATIGRRRADGPRGSNVTVARIAAFEGDPTARQALALHHLARLVDLHDRGMGEPLPLYCAASAAHAGARAAGRDPEAPARKVWLSEWDFPREDKDAEHLLVLGGQRPFDDLLHEPPRPHEQGDGWADDEPSRFGRYARRLWDPLLACEKLVDR